MIILKKLKWSNCFSYGENNDLDLTSNNLTQVVGYNGQGKSSIALILEEGLYNKNSKGIKKADIPNRAGDGSYSIDVEFTKDTSTYKVSVARKSSVKVSLFKDDEDISSHTATGTFKTIESIIGLDFKTFSSLVYQHPNNNLQFLTATDSARKKFLVELLGLNRYTEYFETFKTKSKELNNEINTLNGKIQTIEKWLEDNKLSDTSTKPIYEIDISVEEEESELVSLRSQLDNIQNTNRQIRRNNNYKKETDRINSELCAIPKVESKIDTGNLSSKIGELTDRQRQLKAFADKIKKLNDKCPTCEQYVEESFKKSMLQDCKSEFDKCKEEKQNLQEELDKAKDTNEKYDKRKALESEFSNLFNSIDNELPEEILVAEELEEQISKLNKRIKSKHREIVELQEINMENNRFNTKLSLILEQTEEFTNELEEKQKELDKVQNLYNNLELLKKAFSTNGLLAYKIESLVKDLEDLVNKYLAELSDGRFTLEFYVEKDKLNILITDNGDNITINALSSGELARVTTATLLAIRKLMSSISDTKINFLFLDEIINVLDGEGREKLVEILNKEIDLNTFLVSHQWSHPLLEKLIIEKDDEGISKVEKYGS